MEFFLIIFQGPSILRPWFLLFSYSASLSSERGVLSPFSILPRLYFFWFYRYLSITCRILATVLSLCFKIYYFDLMCGRLAGHLMKGMSPVQVAAGQVMWGQVNLDLSCLSHESCNYQLQPAGCACACVLVASLQCNCLLLLSCDLHIHTYIRKNTSILLLTHTHTHTCSNLARVRSCGLGAPRGRLGSMWGLSPVSTIAWGLPQYSVRSTSRFDSLLTPSVRSGSST